MGLELRLDTLTARRVHAAVEHLDSILHLSLGQVLGETLVEVVLRVAVFGEDDDALVVPGALVARARGAAHMVDELEERPRLSVPTVLPRFSPARHRVKESGLILGKSTQRR